MIADSATYIIIREQPGKMEENKRDWPRANLYLADLALLERDVGDAGYHILGWLATPPPSPRRPSDQFGSDANHRG